MRANLEARKHGERRAASLLVAVCGMALLALGTPSRAEAALFGFEWQYNGTASEVGSAIRLTQAAEGQVGSAFTQVMLTNPTQTMTIQFAFRIPSNGGTPGDGLALVLHRDPRGLAALGEGGSGMGYGGGPPAITPSIAIEFDTFSFSPPNEDAAPHVAYVENGNAYASTHGSEFFAPLGGSIDDGALRHVWVDLVPLGGNPDDLELNVFFSTTSTRPGSPLLTVGIPTSLSDKLGSPDGSFFLGFTGGTGIVFNAHEITALQVSNVTAVPLPAAAWLLLSGLAGFGAVARRRRQRD